MKCIADLLAKHDQRAREKRNHKRTSPAGVQSKPSAQLPQTWPVPSMYSQAASLPSGAVGTLFTPFSVEVKVNGFSGTVSMYGP